MCAVYLLGAAAVLCDAELGYIRHLSRSALAAHCGPYLLLFLAHERLLRRHRSLDGICGVDRWLHPVGSIFARRAAIGHPGDLCIGGIVLAVYLERILVWAPPHRLKKPNHYPRQGAI